MAHSGYSRSSAEDRTGEGKSEQPAGNNHHAGKQPGTGKFPLPSLCSFVPRLGTHKYLLISIETRLKSPRFQHSLNDCCGQTAMLCTMVSCVCVCDSISYGHTHRVHICLFDQRQFSSSESCSLVTENRCTQRNVSLLDNHNRRPRTKVWWRRRNRYFILLVDIFFHA